MAAQPNGGLKQTLCVPVIEPLLSV